MRGGTIPLHKNLGTLAGQATEYGYIIYDAVIFRSPVILQMGY